LGLLSSNILPRRGLGDKASRKENPAFRASCRSVYFTEIPPNYSRESGGTGFPACADKGLNLKDIILKFFHKEHLGKLRSLLLHRPSTRMFTGFPAHATSLR
jgi:hypothetical protein